jgi:hypothetical protein
MNDLSTGVIARERKRPPARALDLDVPEGTVTVHRTVYGQDVERRETIRVPAFATTPARVRVCGSVTRNLGNYNSARVEVSVEVPCYPEQSEIEAAYNFASGLIDRYIPAELDKAVGTEEPPQ